MDETINNRISGYVIAGAAGDALGYPVEFEESGKGHCSVAKSVLF